MSRVDKNEVDIKLDSSIIDEHCSSCLICSSHVDVNVPTDNPASYTCSECHLTIVSSQGRNDKQGGFIEQGSWKKMSEDEREELLSKVNRSG